MNKIKWKKWKNFLLDKDTENDSDTIPYKDSYQKMEDEFKEKITKRYGPLYLGNMGVIPLTENNDPDKIFNFWMGHCNFSITSSVYEKIMEIPGVETFEIFTRYRFRLGIGLAFRGKEVRQQIDDVIAIPLEPIYRQIDGNECLQILTQYFARENTCFAVYINDGGGYSLLKDATLSGLNRQIKESNIKPVQVSI